MSKPKFNNLYSKTLIINEIKKPNGTTDAACRRFSRRQAALRQGESQDRLAQFPGRGRDAHGVVERSHVGVQSGGLAQVQGAPVVAFEGGGANQGAQRVADGLLAVVVAAGLEPGAQYADRLVHRFIDSITLSPT